MMNYDEFKDQVVEHIKEHLPIEFADADVSITPVIKNNDTVQDSLQVKTGDERISPSINLNESFKAYQRTGDFDGELENLAAIRMNADPHLDVDIESILDFDSIKDRIDCRMINVERNSEYLSDKPYKQIEDLALVYSVDLGKNSDGIMNTIVNDSLMERWQVSSDELDRVAMDNLSKNESMQFSSMRDMLKNMMFPDTPDDDPSLDFLLPPAEGPQMYVLTSDDKLYGAKFLADTAKMDEIAEKLGGDFVVIPSSINECILMPDASAMSRETLENMIHEVNATQVPEKEVLSEHAYCYDAQTHELMRADRYEERHAEKQMESQEYGKNAGLFAAAVGEPQTAYESAPEKAGDKPKDTRAVDLDAIEKTEKSNPKHERKSVKAQISEKKAIIAKKAAEKTSPAKNHQAEL